MKSSYQNLIVWQKALDLVVLIYELTSSFPREEIYELTSQIRRSSVSIVSNIAEGSQRSTNKDFDYFLRMAKGSTAELETQLLVSKKLKYIGNDEFLEKILDLLTEIRKMLSSLRTKLQATDSELRARKM